MSTAASTFPSYDHSITPSSAMFRMPNNSTLASQSHGFFTASSNPAAQPHTHCFDDMDILSLKRQYANIDLFDQSTLSNSAEDLSQIERIPYQCDVFGSDDNDVDDYDIPYDETAGYDYNMVIQERLKKANEEFEYDQTPAELKHRQRVSFDTVVKAVDIVQDPAENDHNDSTNQPSISPVPEETSTSNISPRSDTGSHEYTVPLNDTQPKEGLTLLQQIKALQFHNVHISNDRWAATNYGENQRNSSNQEDDVSVTTCKSNENTGDAQDMSNLASNSITSKKAMVVAVNGRFDLQNEDDYVVQYNDKTTDDHYDSTQATGKVSFVPMPPTEPKKKQDLPSRPFPIRPKSSDSGKKSYANSEKLTSDKKNKADTKNQQRPKSAGASKSTELYVERPSSGVDFPELLRKAAEKKRAELRDELRKKEEAEAKRQQEIVRAAECYKKWLQEKASERQRINEEKRLEKQEHEIRKAEEEQQLAELREKKYKEWLERKEEQAKLACEFQKLKADENEMSSIGSSSSIHNSSNGGDHRAFHRWLRRKYEQSLAEKRQIRLEAKRQRRRHRRSIKRHQLQLDLQLAKTFGYS